MLLQTADQSETTGVVRRPGAVLFISCYELGHQPLGVVLPYSLLRQHGFAPTILDLSVQDFDDNAIRRARLIALSVPMHTAVRIGMQVIKRVRALNPAAYLCVYGLYASLNAEYLLSVGVDSCTGGNSEGEILALAESLDRGELSVPRGKHRSQYTQTVLSRQPPVELRRDGVPPLDRYARLEHQGESRLAGYAEASRGCLHRCAHCPIPPVYQGRFFVFSTESVLADIDRQVEAGATHITFGDPDFFNGPGHAMATVRELHRRHPGSTFDATIKVEHILRHRNLFPELRDSGCLFVVSAVESLSDRVLTILGKGHTREDVRTALEILRDAGITMRPTWVAFTPWTHAEDYLDMLRFIEQRSLIDNVDAVQYSIRLLVPPGSLLLSSPEMAPHLRGLDEAAFSHRWQHPDARMDELHSQVAALVERDAAAEIDPAETFRKIGALAAPLCDGAMELRHVRLEPDRSRAPRLSEPWFC